MGWMAIWALEITTCRRIAAVLLANNNNNLLIPYYISDNTQDSLNSIK